MTASRTPARRRAGRRPFAWVLAALVALGSAPSARALASVRPIAGFSNPATTAMGGFASIPSTPRRGRSRTASISTRRRARTSGVRPSSESGRAGVRLTTKADASGDDGAKARRTLRAPAFLRAAAAKFRARPVAYLLIPVVAAFVGWVTNYLAVQMIFYPVEFRGVPLWRRKEVPLGLLGWQGIVPCKTRTMSQTMVDMVTTQLLDIEQVFRNLDPNVVAEKLGPEVPKLLESIGHEVVPFVSEARLHRLSRALFLSLPGRAIAGAAGANRRFLRDLTVSMQGNICSLLNTNHCVIDQMMQDRTLLGQLFTKCAQQELDFLTNSGLWFGFLLGLIQLVVALFWESPWALSIGGTIVGLATNWLALKWIFEPVNPTKFGPFVLQGQFLRRQTEVAKEFSAFFANNVLTSAKLWGSILTDPSTRPSFELVFGRQLQTFGRVLAGGVGVLPGVGLLRRVSALALVKLPNHLHVLHPYVDATLGLQTTLRTQMGRMSSAKFERVLHPIFEEDELTLILAGGFLGFLAGLVQQGIETGYLAERMTRGMAWAKRLVARRRGQDGEAGSTEQ